MVGSGIFPKEDGNVWYAFDANANSRMNALLSMQDNLNMLSGIYAKELTYGLTDTFVVNKSGLHLTKLNNTGSTTTNWQNLTSGCIICPFTNTGSESVKSPGTGDFLSSVSVNLYLEVKSGGFLNQISFDAGTTASRTVTVNAYESGTSNLLMTISKAADWSNGDTIVINGSIWNHFFVSGNIAHINITTDGTLYFTSGKSFDGTCFKYTTMIIPDSYGTFNPGSWIVWQNGYYSIGSMMTTNKDMGDLPKINSIYNYANSSGTGITLDISDDGGTTFGKLNQTINNWVAVNGVDNNLRLRYIFTPQNGSSNSPVLYGYGVLAT